MGLFPTSVVALDGLGLNNDAGVAFLPCFGAGRYGACDVAGLQAERNRHACHNRRGDGNDDFINLLFSHNGLTIYNSQFTKGLWSLVQTEEFVRILVVRTKLRAPFLNF